VVSLGVGDGVAVAVGDDEGDGDGEELVAVLLGLGLGDAGEALGEGLGSWALAAGGPRRTAPRINASPGPATRGTSLEKSTLCDRTNQDWRKAAFSPGSQGRNTRFGRESLESNGRFC
jgi:hypothetical protein